ncbi:MAG: hypothetical protein C4306_06725 [Thermoleophilia bacterium]
MPITWAFHKLRTARLLQGASIPHPRSTCAWPRPPDRPGGGGRAPLRKLEDVFRCRAANELRALLAGPSEGFWARRHELLAQELVSSLSALDGLRDDAHTASLGRFASRLRPTLQ